MYIVIPVLWVDDDWEKQEDLGREVEYTEGELTINTAHIVAYHKDDEGCTMLRLTNGDVFRSRLKFESLKSLLKECEITVELQVTDN
jgi:hypothetical protein